MSEGNRQFEMQIEIAASRGEVWDALTRPEIVSRWFAPEVSVTPGVGGSVQWQWGEMHSWPQTIDVWEPGERLVTRYPAGGTESDDACPLLMDFRLSGEGGSTTLCLVHSGFGPEARFDEVLPMFEIGKHRGREAGAALGHHVGPQRLGVGIVFDP